MKRTKSWRFLIEVIAVFGILSMLLFPFVAQVPKTTASLVCLEEANESIVDTDRDIFENISQSTSDVSALLTATGRQQGDLRFEKKVFHHQNKDVTYNIFKWSELQSLHFQFSGSLQGQPVTSYNFSVTYVRPDLNFETNIETPVEFGTSKPSSLASGTSLTELDPLLFTYFVDNNASSSDPNSAYGNGFGVYKFDFDYTFAVKDEEDTLAPNNFSFVIAVMPDDIDKAIENATQTVVIPTITNPRELMTIYQLRFSSNVFAYVNPDLLQWQAVGRSVDGVDYVLYDDMLKDPKFNNYKKYIYESPESTTGPTFIFDSNGIEGTWTVSVTITGKTQELKLSSPELSTVIVPRPSMWWLWLLIAIIIVLVIIAIILIVYFVRKKREKVW